jgi:hypothetical protein
MNRASRFAVGCVLACAACVPTDESARAPRYTLMMGIDVSGSFQNSGSYEDAVRFAAHYLEAHLNGFGGLQVPTDDFVGSVGGTRQGEAKTFHPIHDFIGKDQDQIEADLRTWFPSEDQLTDFNTFFAQAADLIKQRGLTLAPLNMVLFTDGVPDVARGSEPTDPYKTIDVSPLEYLSRSVTVRVLYPTPTVASNWRTEVSRRRVRLWTQDAEVMKGWDAQYRPELAMADQELLWTWVTDNVDFRVRRERIL